MFSWWADLGFTTTPRAILVITIDILVVYYLIYRVLLTIKGTRAQQMVFGIAVLGATFFIAERLKMTTVSWILDSIISYFIIIIIVLFQQDIRRGLMRIGQVVQQGRSYEVAQTVDEVVAALVHLAKHRIGTIVVFEREASLATFVEHGKEIDGRLSKELLVTLSVPSRDNALHDGAIVVDKGLRVSRAGVLLPLSQQVGLSRDLGTRHRAAIGITEETDAIALVVSEERGEISLCLKGAMARDMEEDAIRGALAGIFGSTPGESNVEKQAQAAAEIGKAVAGLAQDIPSSQEAKQE